MFFSEKKLRQIANLNENIKTNDIVDAINSIGFEVENVETLNHVSGIKFGHVLKTYKNPNSTKLTVCEIEFNDQKRTIQTAATNVKDGDYVIAFIPGSKLKDIEIQEKEMGSIVSQGMLASYSELGFDSKLLTNEMNDGLIILEKIDLNLDPIEYLELNDKIIEVSILSNRSDAQSYITFAKELAAYFHSTINNITNDKSNFKSNIKIFQDKDNLINGAEVKNEKQFKLNIKELILLLKSNIKLENENIINFTNLTLIYTGVSLRSFDLDKISHQINIVSQEGLTYLNDGENNISLLGVDSEKNFVAQDSSKNILFEFSQINEKVVRDNSKISKKTTNSSINNSRTISPGMIELTHSFITNFFSQTSHLINELKKNENKIKFDQQYLINYSGFDITKDEKYKRAIKSLNILGFKFDEYVDFPNTRHDIISMQNIVEDIFRFFGLNNFELSQPSTPSMFASSLDILEKRVSLLGYKQVWTYTLINNEKNCFNPFDFKEIISLKTFTSEEYNSIRNSIALPIYNVFEYNIKRKINNLSLFDYGMINNKKSLLIASNEKSYIEIKSDIEKIANQKFEIRPLDNEWLHKNYNAGLFLGGNLVGWIGKFNPFKINSDIIFAEILEECIYKPSNKFYEFDSSPLKERNVTFEIKNNYENEIYLNYLKKINGIYSIKLVSTFEKDGVVKLSYGVSMSEEASKKFDSIDWTDKEKIFDF